MHEVIAEERVLVSERRRPLLEDSRPPSPEITQRLEALRERRHVKLRGARAMVAELIPEPVYPEAPRGSEPPPAMDSGEPNPDRVVWHGDR